MKEKLFEYIKYNRESATKIAVVVILVIVTIFIGIGKADTEEILVEKDVTQIIDTATTNSGMETSEFVYVDVSGAVNSPGVIKAETNTRVYQAVEMAGGLKKEADVTNINMAAKLRDEDKIYIPAVNEKPTVQNSIGYVKSSSASSVNGFESNLININEATSEQLQELTGVGPSTAEKIINYRNEYGEFKNIDEIKNVSGIGDKTFAKFKDNICI